MTWCHVGRVHRRAALGHRHQLVKLEGKRRAGRRVGRDRKPADVARLPDGADACDEGAAARAVGVAVGRHLRPPSSRACRAAYMYHTKDGARWFRMVPREAGFSAPALPDHVEEEVGDARAQRADTQERPPHYCEGQKVQCRWRYGTDIIQRPPHDATACRASESPSFASPQKPSTPCAWYRPSMIPTCRN